MATIPCPDCGQQVSDQAPQCPNCARPKPGGVPASPPPANKDSYGWVGGLIGGAIVLLVIGYFRYKSEMDDLYTQCLNNPQLDAATCNCFAEQIKKKDSFLNYTPILGRIIEPSDAEATAIIGAAAAQCNIVFN